MLEAQTTDNLENMQEAQTTDNLKNMLEAQTTDNLENMLEAQTTDNLENMQEAQTTDKLDNTLEAQTTDNLENMLEAQTTDNLENMLEAQTTDNLENMQEAQTTDNLDEMLEAQTTDNLENMQEAQTTDNLDNTLEAQTTDNLENMLEAETTDNLENMQEAQTTDNLDEMLEAQTTDNLENMQEAQTTDNLENMLEAQTTDNLENMLEAQTTDNLENMLEAQTTDNLENMLEAQTTDNLENMQEAQTTDNLENPLETQTTYNLENMLEAQTTDNLENMLEAQTTDNLEYMLEAQTTDNLENMREAQTTDNLENMLETQTTDNLDEMLEVQTKDNLENTLEAQTTDNLENILEAQTTDNLDEMLEAQTTDNLENMLEAQTTDNLGNMLEAQTTDNLGNMLEAQTSNNLENMLKTQIMTEEQVHPSKIQDQISGNNALMKEMAVRLTSLKSIQTAAEELIKQATDLQDGDAKDIPHGTNKFWDELQQLTHTLKHMSDRLGNQEPAVEPSLIREQQETLEELALQNSNVNPLNQPVDPTSELMQIEGDLLLGQPNATNPHDRQSRTNYGLGRQVAVVDPSRQFSENELGCDYDGLPSDDESIVLSSGSSYAPSVLSGEDSEDDDEDDDSSVIIPVTQTNKRSWTAIGRVASSEDIGDNEPPRKQRTLPVLGPSTSSEFDATSKNTSDGHHGKTWKKSCFKNVYVESYKSNDGKRNYSKKSYCYYCKNLYKSKMSKHLFAVHAAEPRVRKISQMEVKSKSKRAELQKLNNEGNFNHNVEVLQKGEGNLIVYRRPGVPANAYDYIHCRFCKGFYHHKLLWSHVKTCSFKPDGAENDTERNFIREARCEIAPFLQQQDEDIKMLDEVIDKMKETKENPGLKKVCQEDELIRQFGLYHLGRLGPLEEQRLKDQDNVRTKMRSLARLLVRLNGEELFSYPLSHFICAQKFDLVAKTVKEMYQEIGSSQLGLNLGHYIKQVSLLKSSMCLRRQDCGRKIEANEFTEMFDAEWKGKVSSVANRSKRLKAMNKRCELPSTEDLVSLKKYLVEEIQIKMENPAPTYPEYVYITHLLIARIALFNKRRVNEVSELKVSDFQKRIRGDELDTNTEIYNSLAVSEKALLKRMELLEVRGKSTRGLRKVFVILSTDMVEGLSHLLMVRAQAGVPSTNTFLFSRCTDSPQDGCEALRVVTSKCHNLAFPERVRTTKLRKYLATTTQIMDMRDDELKLTL
ncbi:uncharacterized protein LOC128240355 isoform X3 [Mya arenaria]|uniref:uncharacterized protein LOC128240355 isoform X3 n=1 Tax=Mya arenaria TaxID=6604 RepID=UPI0022E13254|nr:uncharacterized protein LOC128240355 isoform X3 [Mya arenaria]